MKNETYTAHIKFSYEIEETKGGRGMIRTGNAICPQNIELLLKLFCWLSVIQLLKNSLLTAFHKMHVTALCDSYR